MPKFKLQAGMYLVISRVLPYEQPSLVAWSWKYEDVWQYWMDHPDREWDIAFVKGFDVTTPGGQVEQLQVHRILRPIPPKRLARKVAREKHKKA